MFMSTSDCAMRVVRDPTTTTTRTLLLMRLVFEFARKNGYRVNLSSGAATFKRLRGGKPVVEYSVIYDRHLPLVRRMAVSALAALVNGVGVPLMQRLQL